MATPGQVQRRVLKVPFHIGDRGEVAFVTQPNVVAAQEIKAALLTMQGERLMRPGIGSPFATAVFAPMPSDDIEFITSEVQAALIRQCQFSTVNYVHVDTSQNGTMQFEVGFTPLAFNTVLTVTVPIFTATDSDS